MPVTPTAAMSAAETPLARKSSRTISPTLLHHCSGSSSAQPTWSERSATGREARASVSSGGRMSTPMVEVVPMSRPRTQGMDIG